MTRKNTSFQQGYVSPARKLKDGRTAREIKYRLRTAGGGWRQKSETVYNLGAREAKAAVQQRVREAAARPPQTDELTFNKLVENYWQPYLDRRGAKPSTRAGYKSNLKNHILPRFAALRVVDISPMHIEELLQANNKLSAKTVRNLIALLQSIFSLAVDLDLMAHSPIKKKHKPTIRRSRKTAWSAAQVRAILDSVPVAYRPVFYCIALTGIRVGELLALRWRDIDLLNGKIRIEHSLFRGQLVSPKTEGSERTIPIGEQLSQVLRAHRNASSQTTAESFVFSKADGSPLHPDILRRDVLYPTLDRLGIERPARQCGFHAFRHSAASLINSETGNLKLAQHLLGHSTPTMTDVYTHVSKEAEREAAEAIERAVFGDLFEIVRNSSNKTDSARPN